MQSSGQALWMRAKEVIAGGNMLLSKRPTMFSPGLWPSYYSKSKGVYIWDLDGIEYLDMSIMGIGTNILGYRDKCVDKAVSRIIRYGNMTTLNCPEEVQLAEDLVSIHRWASKVKFARSGGEANAMAVRIARAASGKSKVAICGYHGWHDWYLSTNLKGVNELEEHLLPGLEPNGVPIELRGTVIPFVYNDIERLKEIVNEHDLAAIKMEVQRNAPPNKSYLEDIRKMCTEKGIVLIFDECTSGFRETYGGLHLKYGVEPDIAMFGKALGNGYAITAVLGREDIMDAVQRSFISSTFWTERIGPTAALECLKQMRKRQSWEYITVMGMKIRELWKRAAKDYELDIEISGIPALSSFKLNHKDWLLYKTFITESMLEDKILAGSSFYCSIAHKDRHFDRYELSLRKAFKRIGQSVHEGRNIELRGKIICDDGFKRLN